MVQRKAILFAYFMCFLVPESMAQGYGGVAMALSSSSVALANEFSPLNNPGASAFHNQPSVAISYFLPYGVPGLSRLGFSGIMPGLGGVTQLGIRQEGLEGIKKSQASLGFAGGTDRFSLGGSCGMVQTDLGEYGSSQQLLVEVGGLARIIPRVDFAIHVYNLTLSQYRTAPAEYIPLFIRAGVGFLPIESLRLLVEFQTNHPGETEFRGGFSYSVSEHFAIQAGTQTNRPQGSLGFSLKAAQFSIDPALVYHPDLGMSMGFSMNYVLEKNNWDKP